VVRTAQPHICRPAGYAMVKMRLETPHISSEL
jgi:hypothetical protein